MGERNTRTTRIVFALLVAVAVFFGWRTFWFLTDDAHIAYRYVSNAMAGRGLVWNPEPFVPVEGYTSFLWVAVLWAVWGLFGIEPPEAANWLSLACGYGTLALVWRIGSRMRLPKELESRRFALLALAFLAIVTNRTFLAWLSSGLETAPFNLCFTWWVAEASVGRRGRSFPARLATAAALTALARPDGLLAVAGTLAIVAWERDDTGARRFARHAWLGLAPLLAVVAHVAWRRSFYGEWLPNTYYAKNVAPWPKAGAIYAASFVVEYGYWVVGLFAAACVARSPGRALRAARAATGIAVGPGVALAVLAFHAGYYVIAIGGDHFEYRVLSHLVPLLALATVRVLAELSRRPPVVFAGVGVAILASWPIPWVHWYATRGLDTREETHVLAVPIAPLFPALLRPLVRPWDRLQDWLVFHHIGMRHQEHKVFYEHQAATWPPREDGSEIAWEGRPVLAERLVGVPGWVLPNVAIVDRLGLNDRVIARFESARGGEYDRRMAHDREPPEGYVEAFRPNVRIVRRRAIVERRVQPLTDGDIRAIETMGWR